ncbi:hypothetical protein KJ641_01050 [Patescibacteria group bacterium]|nr:hypothetical protein [Patescibacteria group bacterium]MBU1895444.1 hypothetical protein [Patescibacteria group bacterium]
MKYLLSTIILIIFFVYAGPLYGAMSGGSFDIPYDAMTVFQGADINGGVYEVEDTGGEASPGITSAGDYSLNAGFRAVDSGLLSSSLSKSTITLSFGATPLTIVASDNLTLTVTTDSTTGYAATITESGNLASGANDIDDVSDGTVTAGSEEYGISTSGADGQLASDTAISGTVTVASNSGAVSSSEVVVTFDAAAAQSTKAGSYSHTVTLTVTANP